MNLTIGGTAFASQYSDCCLQSVMAEWVREFVQAMIESEPETALVRPRHGCRPTADAQNRDGRNVSPAIDTATARDH